MTQRNAPDAIPDDDESGEENTITSAPGAMGGGQPVQARPPQYGGPLNTPTAFTPQPLTPEQAAAAEAAANAPPSSGPSGPSPTGTKPPPPLKSKPPALPTAPHGSVTNQSSAPPASGGFEVSRPPPHQQPLQPPQQQPHAQPLGTHSIGLPQGSLMRGAPPAQPLHNALPTLHGGYAAPALGQAAQIAQAQLAQSHAPPPQQQHPSPLQQQPIPPPPSSIQQQTVPPVSSGPLAIRADTSREQKAAAFHVVRSRAYSFVVDARGAPIELGSGRFAKAYLGEERWLESKTDFRREIVIKILQKGVDPEDHMRFQMEKELLERVQGHPNIVELFASGESEDIQFVPPSIRDKVETEFMILERLEMSLEERLKGSRSRGQKDDLLACDMRERIFRVLDYMIPIASAIEYAHLVRNICHRDLKPANVLIKIPDPNLRGSNLEVRLADFNVAKLSDSEVQLGMTQMKGSVPGTLFFQSPEQETNVIELLVNVQQGVPEVEFFEDFYIQIAKNDTFSLYNRGDSYPILYADRARKRLVLARPYRDTSETNVRARIQKSVGRPADIYSLGAVLYYLISGAYANPKTLYDAFHKFIEYEKADENNTIDAYLRHEYSVIQSLRAPKADGGGVAPADRFFTYKHYLDGNGELIDPNVMLIIAKCMIRNKPDSYCQAHDLETRGISDLVQDLISLYALYGVHPAARPTHLAHRHQARRGALTVGLGRVGDRIRWAWLGFLSIFRRKR